MQISNDWKTKAFIIGGIVGLLSGIFAAYIFIQQNEKYAAPTSITARDGVKLGLGLLTFLRLIADIAKRD